MGTTETPTETTRLVEARPWYDMVRIVTLAALMVCFSVGLINFNKWLMDAHRFPHAVPLVLFHMVFCSSLAFILRLIQPSLFPALTDPYKSITVDANFMLKGCLPIAIVFAASLVLSNMAYTHLSVAFLQMIKQSNLIWTYCFSVLASLETFSWNHIKLILLASCAVCMTVEGELHFVLIGFLIQGSAILIESVRIILQALLLSGKKLDPLSYVLLISPLSGVLLASFLGIISFLPPSMLGPGLALPSMAKCIDWFPILVASALVAFCLNVCIAFVIKETSAMSYVMCQLLKDIAVVLIGAFLLSEAVTSMQVLGFSLQIVVALVWSLMKSFPAEFGNGITNGLWALYRGRTERDKISKSVEGLPPSTRPNVEKATESGV